MTEYTNSHRNRSNLKVWLAIFVILQAIISSVLIEKSLESLKREQARYNLMQIKYCYSELLTYSNKSTSEVFDICTNKMKTSYTGDVYIIDPVTLEFVHETSTDVPRKEPLYFTKESVGKYFRDWESAKRALYVMLLGKNSEPGVNAYYMFDNSIEWLEWIYLPDEVNGARKYIVIQGTQKDEVLQHIMYVKVVIFGFTTLITLILLVANSKRRLSDYNR